MALCTFASPRVIMLIDTGSPRPPCLARYSRNRPGIVRVDCLFRPLHAHTTFDDVRSSLLPLEVASSARQVVFSALAVASTSERLVWQAIYPGKAATMYLTSFHPPRLLMRHALLRQLWTVHRAPSLIEIKGTRSNKVAVLPSASVRDRAADVSPGARERAHHETVSRFDTIVTFCFSFFGCENESIGRPSVSTPA